VSVTIHPTAVVDKSAEIGDGTEIGPFCYVGPGVKLGRNNKLRNHIAVEGPSVIGDANVFYAGASIGSPPQDLKYANEPTTLTIGDRNYFRECVTVNRGTVGGGGHTSVGSGCLFMAYAHVAHDCHLGDNVIMANCATLAGHVTVEEYVSIGGLTPVQQFVRLGAHAFIGGATRVAQDVVPYIKMGGIPPVVLGTNSIGLSRRGFAKESIDKIEKVVRLLFKAGLNTTQALAKIRETVESSPEVDRFVKFVESSQRGILKG
jgi:UDP-N-acetylglucosamine acyltransferase